MAKTSLPPGFRFHPTDLELSLYYLKRKIMGKAFRFEAISEVELYKFAPWDLPDKSCLQSKDLEWYFFCPGDRKYSNGSRKNRATDTGYWKTTGKDRSVSYNARIVAKKKTLVFHEGRVPKGVRTNWVMHEYRLEDKELVDAGFLLDAYVLCKIHKKSGPGPKIGEQYGAPFREEDWEEEGNDSSVLVSPTCHGSMNMQHQLTDHALQSHGYAVYSIPPYSPEHINIDRLWQELSESNTNETFALQGGEMSGSPILHGTFTERSFLSDGNEMYDGLRDVPGRVELKSADGMHISSETGEHALEHHLLDLSNQGEPGPIEDLRLLTNGANGNMPHNSLLGIGDGSYLEMNDFQFPVGGHFPELAVHANFSGHRFSFQNLNGVGVPPGTDIDAYFASSEIIYP